MDRMGWLVVGGCTLMVLLFVIVIGVTASNQEKRLRNAITAKQKDNQSQFDNMWKKISQVAQVTDGQKQALLEIFVQHAQARAGKGEDKALVKWIQESVPQVDTKTFAQLQNIIVSSRDAFTERQRELLDMKREHDNTIDLFPSSLFCGGRPKIDVIIVTSTRADEAFKTGKDDDTDVFQKKSKPVEK
jgi:hypothetical protein